MKTGTNVDADNTSDHENIFTNSTLLSLRCKRLRRLLLGTVKCKVLLEVFTYNSIPSTTYFEFGESVTIYRRSYLFVETAAKLTFFTSNYA